MSQPHRRQSRRFALSIAIAAAPLALALQPDTVRADDPHKLFDPNPVWPLCGRIELSPPTGWSAADGCPVERWGNPDFADYPISSGYGPRILVSESRYDFHPGIDLPTPQGTPVFAIANGIVKKVTGSSEVRVEIQHYRPGSWGGDCALRGCYHSVNQHLESAAVDEGARVQKGQLIGFSGQSNSGFEHLHFEIRNAPADDATSSWMHDTIQPLRVLPYHSNPGGTQIAISAVDSSDPMNPKVTVQAIQAADQNPELDKRKYDLNEFEVQVYDNRTRMLVRQPGMVTDDNGFHVNPSVLNIELRNRMFTHKDGGSQPWESFDSCPYSHEHGSSYDAFVHTCQHDPNDDYLGSFNGIEIAPEAYHSTSDYRLTVTFTELIGVIDAADLCIVANVKNVHGSFSGSPATWNCTF